MNQSPCQAEVSKLPTNLCCLRHTEMSGSWLSAPGGELPLQKHSDSGSDPSGCPEFSSVTCSAKEQPTTNAGKFYLLDVDTSLVLMLFSPNGTMTACVGQTTQTIHSREQCGTAVAGWNGSLEPRNVMKKLQRLGGGRRKIEDTDLHLGRSHMTSMHSLDIRFALR